MASMAEERPESSNLTAHRGSIRIDHLVGSCRHGLYQRRWMESSELQGNLILDTKKSWMG
jgi:hypothetical protein